MARIKNDEKFAETKESLLSSGLRLIKSKSYDGIGINDILKDTNVAKGSFYHYFSSKEDFVIQVSHLYHQQQILKAESFLYNRELPALDRLKSYFEHTYNDFKDIGFTQGCLMCNLSTELSHEPLQLKKELREQWDVLSSIIANCIAELDKSKIGLAHLSDKEAADWLLNSWSGALTRMKATGNGAPLSLFLKSTFTV